MALHAAAGLCFALEKLGFIHWGMRIIKERDHDVQCLDWICSLARAHFSVAAGFSQSFAKSVGSMASGEIAAFDTMTCKVICSYPGFLMLPLMSRRSFQAWQG